MSDDADFVFMLGVIAIVGMIFSAFFGIMHGYHAQKPQASISQRYDAIIQSENANP